MKWYIAIFPLNFPHITWILTDDWNNNKRRKWIEKKADSFWRLSLKLFQVIRVLSSESGRTRYWEVDFVQSYYWPLEKKSWGSNGEFFNQWKYLHFQIPIKHRKYNFSWYITISKTEEDFFQDSLLHDNFDELVNDLNK